MPNPADLMPPPGDFDRVIILQRRQVTRNELREPIDNWQDLVTCWAAKVETRGQEETRADEVAANLQASFVIRFLFCSPILNPRDRLLYNPDPSMPAQDGLVFNIRGVTEIGRRAGQRIDCWARADQLAGAGGA